MGSLVREYRQFPSGSTFKPTETINNIADGTTITLHDPGPIYEAPPANSDYDYCVFNRAFWNVAGSIQTSGSVNVTVKGATTATCWYSYGCSPGGVEAAITCYAFDVDGNAEMAGDTPIGSVSPSGLWTDPDKSVMPSDKAPITIDAKNSINGKPFDKWLAFGAGATSGDDIVIPAGGGGFYVALYDQPDIDVGIHDIGDILQKWPDFEIDWVVDPSPLDKFRLMLLASQLAAHGGIEGKGPFGSAEARKELSRVRSQLKQLEARARQLEDTIQEQHG